MIPAPLTGEKVVLAAWEPDEAGRYLSLRDDEVFRFTTESPDLDEKMARHNISQAQVDPHLAPFAIRDRSGEAVGNLAVSRLGSRAVLSYWLATEARGKGLAVDALRLASDWAMENWDVEYLELEIDRANRASIAVAEGAGYRRHGLRLESACGGPALLYRRP